MKRKVLILILVLSACMASAQDGEQVGTFVGGVRVGATTSQISGDNLSGFHQLGATAGIFANWCFVDNPKFGLKLQLEMDFAMKGSHSYTPPKQTADASSKYSLTLGYIEVPVLARMRFARITIRNISDFEFEVGPMIGVKVFHREVDVYGVIQGLPEFSRFELSAVAGLTYCFKQHHGITLRYANSILAVRIPNWAVNRRIYKQYNSVIYLSYSYQF